MLLEFSCENHKSIREEIEFSAIAGSGDEHPHNLLSIGSYSLLRTAVIFGANGSGKSTLLDALCFVRSAALGESLKQTPHKLSSDAPSRYCIQFLADGTRYALGFTLHGSVVCEEYLFYFPQGKQTKIYTRTENHLSTGVNFRKLHALSANALPADQLIFPLVCAADNRAVLQNAHTFFADILTPYHPDLDDHHMEKTVALLRSNTKLKAAVLSILSVLDTGIVDLSLDGEQIATVYPSFSTDLLTEESGGIRRLIDFLFPLLDMIYHGKILLCDEPEAHLHELLLHKLLHCLMQTNLPAAQLIFSTQSTALLDLSILRRDQIWFTELRRADRSTDLYSLAEIRHIGANDDIRRDYIAGKYGAVPEFVADRNGR
ncbi:MAG: ATP-binding protein [Clostridia bacterium]|nr:ATP-binding protein [Clostridia bacterium]